MDEEQENRTKGFRIGFRGLAGFADEHGEINQDNPEFQKFLATCLAAINHAYKCCTFNHNDIDIIVLAHPDEIGAQIHEWQDAAGVRRGYTGEEGYVVTVAKTVAHRLEGGGVKSSIVINAGMLGNLVDVIQAETPLDEWDSDKQSCLYTVAHELGHAHDYALRSELGGDEIHLQDEDDWTLISKQHAGSLTGEFLACFYSAPAVTEKLQTSMIEDWHENAEKAIRSVLNVKLSMMGNTSLYAAHNLWYVMIEYSKLIGHRCNNSELPRPSLWEDADPDEQEVFDSIEVFLTTRLAPNSDSTGSHMSQLPGSNIEAFALDSLYPLWQKLCQCYGIYLQDEPDEDANDAQD